MLPAKLYWRGTEGGMIIEVHEPDQVTLQHISIGNNTGMLLYTASAPRYVVTLQNLVVWNYCSADHPYASPRHR